MTSSSTNAGYIAESVRLRERQALEYPLMFLFGEAIRVAGFTALALGIWDVLNPGTLQWDAGARLRVVALFGVVFGALNLARIRLWRRSDRSG